MNNLSPRELVVNKLNNVSNSLAFFSEKNPSADFAEALGIIAEAQDILSRLPDKPAIKYNKLWDKAFLADKSINTAVRLDLERQLRDFRDERMLPEFRELVITTATAKGTYKEGREVLLDVLHAAGRASNDKLIEACTKHGLEIPASLVKAPEPVPSMKAVLLFKAPATSKKSRGLSPINPEETIRSLGGNERVEDKGEHVTHPNQLVLALEMGQNPKTEEPQWELRGLDGQFYVLDKNSPPPPAEYVEAVYEITHRSHGITFVRFLHVLEVSERVVPPPPVQEAEPKRAKRRAGKKA